VGVVSQCFFVVFRVLNAIFNWVCLNNFVIFLVYFPTYVKAAHSVLWCCGPVSVFCFCGAGCLMVLFILYFLLRSVTK
jgi:hypothetical protein